MQDTVVFCFSIALLLLVSPFAASSDSSDREKERRGSSGLISMPRVGRSDVDLAWALHAPELHAWKRQGLIPFPRVGRSGGGSPIHPTVVLLDEDAVPRSLWFNSKFGRRNKRSTELPWALVAFKDYPRVSKYPQSGEMEGEDEEDAVLMDQGSQEDRTRGAVHQ